MSLPSLETYGLSSKESQIYDILMRLGEVSAARLIVESGLKRSTTYKNVYELEQKGLVTQRIIEKKLHFRPEPPSKLLEFVDTQIKHQEKTRKDLQTLLPDLMSTFILAVEKPIVTTFAGIKGLKKIYMDTLRDKQPIYAMLTTAEVEPDLFDWLTTYYAKARAKAGISAQVIASTGSWAKEYAKKDTAEARTTILVPQDRFPFQHEIDIYGSKVAFINYKKGDSLIGVVINHPQIAASMKACFELAWQGAENVNG